MCLGAISEGGIGGAGGFYIHPSLLAGNFQWNDGGYIPMNEGGYIPMQGYNVGGTVLPYNPEEEDEKRRQMLLQQQAVNPTHAQSSPGVGQQIGGQLLSKAVLGLAGASPLGFLFNEGTNNVQDFGPDPLALKGGTPGVESMGYNKGGYAGWQGYAQGCLLYTSDAADE